MRVFTGALLLGLILSLGCGAGAGTGGGPGGIGATDSGGWTVMSQDAGELPNRATTYGSYDGKRGDHVRATVSAQPEAVDARLYVQDLQGKETTLGEKKETKEAVLEGEVPRDATLLLSLHLNSGEKTSYKYKIERR